MEQDLRDEGAAKSQHLVHLLPFDDHRATAIVAALVERLANSQPEEEHLELLVLVPTHAEAVRLSRQVNEGLDPSGPLLIVLSDSARDVRRLSLGARAAVATPTTARWLLKRSALKVAGVTHAVLGSLSTLIKEATEALEDVVSELPKTAERIAIESPMTPETEGFLERHARRARQLTYDAPEVGTGKLQYIVCEPSVRRDMLSRVLDQLNPDHATVVSSEEEAEVACGDLAALGIGPEDTIVSFGDGEIEKGEPLVILYTAPLDADDLKDVYAVEPKQVVALVAPQELSAFRRTFRGASLVSMPQTAVANAASRVESLTGTIEAATSRALHHQLVALQPLFAAHDPAVVAAALLALLEEGAPSTVAGIKPAAQRRIAAAAPVESLGDERPSFVERERPVRDRPVRERPPRERFERSDRGERGERGERRGGPTTPIFMNVGERDGAKIGDLVGAIANESGISSDLIGRITMRDMHSVVEVDSTVADQVIEAITGKTIRGRVVNARVDRKGGGDDRRPPRRDGGGGGRFDRGDRPARPRSREGGFERGRGGDRPFRGRGRDDFGGGPRSFRDDDRGSRGPRAIRESRDWGGERGERLSNARRPRRNDGA